ncbi:hypothetical protein BCR35DRAFT_329999 [Leucosporidium creatinivorum]|uniref:F-box domain-containing protein n=1 Tax=Leucosporidium creatinivorum TaxID=106004 RepID=A0A1Y2G0L4_9BASI|nr:hypothetical protein BCR35DRAFT_329999 [Leucosporidium creatinivorum]
MYSTAESLKAGKKHSRRSSPPSASLSIAPSLASSLRRPKGTTAVIQDLPPELLYHIVQLLSNDNLSLPHQRTSSISLSTSKSTGALPHLTAPLALTSLHILWGTVPNSILQPLLANTPFLRSLDVKWSSCEEGPTSASELSVFDGIAPQLLRLSLVHDGGNDQAEKVPAVASFLANCTSLTHLWIQDPPYTALLPYLTALNVKLRALETTWLGAEDAPGVASALSLPRMGQLQRWGLKFWDGEEEDLIEELERWATACKAKGVQPIYDP